MTFAEMGRELLTQDNQATGDPIFVVQQRRRIYGMDTGYGGDCAWIDPEGDEVTGDERMKLVEIRIKTGDDEINHADRGHCRCVGYIDIWEFVQPFFTAKAASEYIRANKHRMTDPRVYVDSAYRNKEWQAMRAFLISCAVIEHGQPVKKEEAPR